MGKLKRILLFILGLIIVIPWIYFTYYISTNIQEVLDRFPLLTNILQLLGIIGNDPIEVGIKLIGYVITIVTFALAGIFITIVFIIGFIIKGTRRVLEKARDKKNR